MTSFRVTYDGPALAASEMDARELAPALLAVADLLDASTQALFEGQAKPQVNVKGSFKTGSFNIDLVLVTNFLAQIKSIFGSDTAGALSNGVTILTTLGFIAKAGFVGLVQLIKWLRGRPIKHVEVSGDSATIYVEDGNESVQVELSVLRLLRSVAVRESLEKVLAPLDRDGIDTFAAGESVGLPSVVITEEEKDWFRAPTAGEELIVDETRRMAFSIVSLAFKDDNKWRLYDGAATIHANIADTGFLSRVDQNLVSFAKGDLLVCRVRVQQWQTVTGARTEYTVVEVLEHRPAWRQIQLPGT